MKSEDDGVKNSILTIRGERKRRIHRISKIRKEDSNNICEGKIMAILKGHAGNPKDYDWLLRRVEIQGLKWEDLESRAEMG
ncbi:hypothetical protein Tco_1309040 [Tanacetum coccineum]